MTIVARYTDTEGAGVSVTLAADDVLGSLIGPTVALVSAAPGNRDYDALELLIAEGAVTVSAFEPPPAVVPETISDRQFAQVLALDGVITEDEALAWAARGDLPKRLLDALDHIPEADGQRFGARMMLSAATLYERNHPLVPMLGALLGMDAAALDAVWTRGAEL